MALEITGNSANMEGCLKCFFFMGKSGKSSITRRCFFFKKNEFPASKAPYLMIGGCQIARFDYPLVMTNIAMV